MPNRFRRRAMSRSSSACRSRRAYVYRGGTLIGVIDRVDADAPATRRRPARFPILQKRAPPPLQPLQRCADAVHAAADLGRHRAPRRPDPGPAGLARLHPPAAAIRPRPVRHDRSSARRSMSPTAAPPRPRPRWRWSRAGAELCRHAAGPTPEIGAPRLTDAARDYSIRRWRSGGQLDMGRPAELADRPHPFEPIAAVDQHLRVAREGGGIARDIGDRAARARRRAAPPAPWRRRGADRAPPPRSGPARLASSGRRNRSRWSTNTGARRASAAALSASAASRAPSAA